MNVEDYIDAVAEQGSALLAAATRAGWDAPIPDCPGWDVAALVGHLAGTHRWATAHLRGEHAASTGRQRWLTPTPPADEPLPAWARTSLDELVAALRTAPADLACWTFLPSDTPRLWWARRQAHETAVHRADVDLAVDLTVDLAAGLGPDISPDLAADGIDELLYLTAQGRRPGPRADPPASFALRPSDSAHSWSVSLGPDGWSTQSPARAPEGPKPDRVGTARGTCRSLYLLLWNRTPPDPVELTGDPAALTAWREQVRIT